jgi:hypothetical protein
LDFLPIFFHHRLHPGGSGEIETAEMEVEEHNAEMEVEGHTGDKKVDVAQS